MSLNRIAFYTGVGGDLLLQVIAYGRGDLSGLAEYYAKHGRFESLMIAGGMMMLFNDLYESTVPNTIEPATGRFAAGAAIDVGFRVSRLAPTLDPYYAALSTPLSAVYGGVSLLLPLLIDKAIH